MYKFTVNTNIEQYRNLKTSDFGNVSFEYVPNTAAGYERSRCYINMIGHRYLLSVINEKDFFLICEEKTENFSVYFSIEDNQIIIDHAKYNGKTEKAERNLKKYARLLASVYACIKYDRVVEYIAYPLNIA